MRPYQKRYKIWLKVTAIESGRNEDEAINKLLDALSALDVESDFSQIEEIEEEYEKEH